MLHADVLSQSKTIYVLEARCIDEILNQMSQEILKTWEFGLEWSSLFCLMECYHQSGITNFKMSTNPCICIPLQCLYSTSLFVIILLVYSELVNSTCSFKHKLIFMQCQDDLKESLTHCFGFLVFPNCSWSLDRAVHHSISPLCSCSPLASLLFDQLFHPSGSRSLV